MNYVVERTLVTPTVLEVVFLAADGFKFTGYIDAGDTCAEDEVRERFKECMSVDLQELAE